MSKEKEASVFQKSPEFCDVTGKHHKWKSKMHGKRAFPTECADCGMKAESLMTDIREQEEEASEQARILEEERKAKDEAEKEEEMKRITE